MHFSQVENSYDSQDKKKKIVKKNNYMLQMAQMTKTYLTRNRYINKATTNF